jgi:predicted nucleotidyltransferase component of viral defense system
MKNTIFYKQVELLLSILEDVFSQSNIAMKGGTAINMFIQDLPRLSVDIDLAYTGKENRDIAFAAINDIFSNIAKRLHRLSDVYVDIKYAANKVAKQIIISRNYVTVKVEINHIFRGAVYPTIEAPLCNKAQEIFKRFYIIPILSKEDLYAGKICAALDRQHPRDLFDMHIFFKNDNLDERLKQAFIVYLISHNRPMVELLNPNRFDIKDIYNKEFSGMTEEYISLSELEHTREVLIDEVRKKLTDSDKEFLFSLKVGKPKWELLPIEGISNLPSVQWKMANIYKMDEPKRKYSLNKLAKELEKP